MSIKNKRVFVSGGAGVIGHQLCPLLQSSGAIVMVGDLKSRPINWNGEILYRQGDLNFMTQSEIESFQPEIFIHLAATFERSTESYEFWEENFLHNVNLSHYLIGIMKDLSSLKRVIFASSYLIYDPNLYSFNSAQSKPYSLKETDPVYPRNLTGMAKFAHEIEIRFLEGFKKDSVSFVNVRIYRGYGKGSRCIISRWIRSLIKGEEIFIYRSEGIFDYIYAEDTALGLLKLAEYHTVNGIINLGTGKARRVSDVIDVLKKYFPDMKYSEVESDIPYEASQADMSLFEKSIGWIPERFIENAIPDIIEYEMTHDNIEQKAFNILVTSISRKIPMINAVRNASKKFGTQIKVFGGDLDPNCVGRYFVDTFWEMPRISELSQEKIIDFCKTNNIKAIIPSRDGELQFWASIKDQLNNIGVHVLISPLQGVVNCLDKLIFSQILLKNGLPAIPSFIDIKEIKTTNLVVKERYGAGSLDIALNVSKNVAIQHAKKLSSPIFQPFIEGKEFSVDVYIDKTGKAKGAVVRSRDLILNGESQITSTISNPQLETLCCNIAEKLQLYGHIVLQILEDEDKKFHVIECNSRFGGASTLSIAMGLDSFYWFILEGSNVDLTQYSFVRSRIEKTQVRFPEDIVINGSCI
ncbi:MAG: ATP-grasp domain-containing protein [Bacteroidia bacterium]|nr:ATP-grasp domain-containing protein [Bacteroidia bacterium]